MARKTTSWRVAVHAGSGMALGAGVGMLFSMMLPEPFLALPFAGAVFGAVIGAIWGF